jgi:hypothetical protein
MIKIKIISLVGAIIIPVVAGCASNPLALATVGPQPGRPAAPGLQGSVQVFSATQTSNPIGDIGSASYFHPHSGYQIKAASGQPVRFVFNHASDMDEWPDLVNLPPGHYQIEAQSACCGLVSVPVVIENGRTTVVHLDRNWSAPSHTPANQVVFLPNGESVGWSGSVADSGQ